MNPQTQISVVITTRNRASRLKATLDDLAAQNVAQLSWELIVIDNGSDDETPAVLDDARQRLPLRVYRDERPGKCRAQNLALQYVYGALIVFTDDDVSIDPGWLSALWQAAERWPGADLLGGAIRVRMVGELPAWLADPAGRAILDRHGAHYHPRPDEGYTDVPPIGPNMAVRRALFDTIRFDENVGPDGSKDYIKGGDTDLNKTLIEQGHLCVYVPDALIGHHVYAEQLTLASLFEGAFRRGRKNAYLYPKKKGLRIAGAPFSLWMRLCNQWLRYMASRQATMVKRYEIGMKYHYRRGYLAQTRRQRSP